MTHTRADIQRLLADGGLRPSRALGQNFVADPNTVRRIARLAEVGPGTSVLEIGAGLGSLTLALAETGAASRRWSWTATCSRCCGLRSRTGRRRDRGRRHADGLGRGPRDGPTRRWVLVANLPYNIATPLVADLLDGVPAIERMLVMVQREVAERLAAHVGDDGYGAVSVKVDYWASARVVGKVPASVFVPRPNVESALVEIVRRPVPAVDPGLVSAGTVFSLVRAGFAQRRKMLRRALAGVVGPDAFACAGVDPAARAEELDVAAWGRLAACLR